MKENKPSFQIKYTLIENVYQLLSSSSGNGAHCIIGVIKVSNRVKLGKRTGLEEVTVTITPVLNIFFICFTYMN